MGHYEQLSLATLNNIRTALFDGHGAFSLAESPETDDSKAHVPKKAGSLPSCPILPQLQNLSCVSY